MYRVTLFFFLFFHAPLCLPVACGIWATWGLQGLWGEKKRLKETSDIREGEGSKTGVAL